MATTTKLKESFEVEEEYGAFYTGGDVVWSSTGDEILCQNTDKINIISAESGKIEKSIGIVNDGVLEEDIIYCFSLSLNDEFIATAHRSGLVKLWSKVDGSLIKMWKGNHNAPIAKLCFRLKGTIIASAGSDSIIRVWDFEKKTCVSTLKGSHGVISVLAFHPNMEKSLIFGSGDDNAINCWDYLTKELTKQFTGHYSKVTDISFVENSNFFVSVGRDQVLILWDIEKAAQVRILPIYETLESVCILPHGITLPNGYVLESPESENLIYAAIGGEFGKVSVWECTKSKIIYIQTNSLISKSDKAGGLAITQMFYHKNKSQLLVVSADHNIIVYNISSFHCSKQLVGFSDEILDICFVGKKGRFLAVATNSNDIKFYDTSNMNCQLLKGHTDIVIGFSSYKNLLLSCSKDNTIRIWELNPGTLQVRCVARGAKHTATVGSVCFGRILHTFCVSVSQDTCLKLWSVPKEFENSEEPTVLTCMATKIAHEKDINCVTISPNDRFVVTASQDKTAKLWSASDLEFLGVFRGHRRGVWSVRFSPEDQVLLTSSADCTLKLWSVVDMSCLKSIEGHESSVLWAEFISHGMQILSASSDGLIKVWDIKSGDCCTTLDKHEGRIWTIAVSPDETFFFSGGSDSLLIRWKDVTEEKKLAEFQQKQEELLDEQELNNLIQQKKMLKALRLALKLERPNLTLKIINNVIIEGDSGLEDTIKCLNEIHKENLLKHAITWNTNSRFCRPAQLVLTILSKQMLSGEFRPTNMSKLIEDTLPYTERHFKRTTEHLKDLNFIEFTLNAMEHHLNMNVDH